MAILGLIIKIVLIVFSLAMVVVVLMQSPKNSGVATALSGESENFFGRTKTRGKEGKLQKATKIFAVIIGVLAIALAVLPAA